MKELQFVLKSQGSEIDSASNTQVYTDWFSQSEAVEEENSVEKLPQESISAPSEISPEEEMSEVETSEITNTLENASFKMDNSSEEIYETSILKNDLSGWALEKAYSAMTVWSRAKEDSPDKEYKSEFSTLLIFVVVIAFIFYSVYCINFSTGYNLINIYYQ